MNVSISCGSSRSKPNLLSVPTVPTSQTLVRGAARITAQNITTKSSLTSLRDAAWVTGKLGKSLTLDTIPVSWDWSDTRREAPNPVTDY